MVQKRKIYDAAFKRQAAELCKERKNISELARELGVQLQQLYRWRKEYDIHLVKVVFQVMVI